MKHTLELRLHGELRYNKHPFVFFVDAVKYSKSLSDSFLTAYNTSVNVGGRSGTKQPGLVNIDVRWVKQVSRRCKTRSLA
jgi:hypothetical protein